MGRSKFEAASSVRDDLMGHRQAVYSGKLKHGLILGLGITLLSGPKDPGPSLPGPLNSQSVARTEEPGPDGPGSVM